MAALSMVSRAARLVARPWCGALVAKPRSPPTRSIHTLPSGTFPVMLTPFNEDKSIDWNALDGSLVVHPSNYPPFTNVIELYLYNACWCDVVCLSVVWCGVDCIGVACMVCGV